MGSTSCSPSSCELAWPSLKIASIFCISAVRCPTAEATFVLIRLGVGVAQCAASLSDSRIPLYFTKVLLLLLFLFRRDVFSSSFSTCRANKQRRPSKSTPPSHPTDQKARSLCLGPGERVSSSAGGNCLLYLAYSWSALSADGSERP